MIKVRDYTDSNNTPELTEKEMFKKVDFSDSKRFIKVKPLKSKTDEIEAELNGIENELTLIRLSQMNIEYRLKRLKILAKKNE